MDRCARTSLARGRWCGLWSSETAAARGNPHQKGASALARLAERLWHLLGAGPRATALDGTLFEPVQEGTGIRGGWGGPERRRAGPAAFATLVGVAGLSALAVLMAQARNGRRGRG